MAGQTRCGLKGCFNLLKDTNATGARVGYKIDDRLFEVIVCPYHAYMIMRSPRGSYNITADRQLKAIPAKRIII